MTNDIFTCNSFYYTYMSYMSKSMFSHEYVPAICTYECVKFDFEFDVEMELNAKGVVFFLTILEQLVEYMCSHIYCIL